MQNAITVVVVVVVVIDIASCPLLIYRYYCVIVLMQFNKPYYPCAAARCEARNAYKLYAFRASQRAAAQG